MGLYYPQAGVDLIVRWENYGQDNDPELNKTTYLSVRPKIVTVNINDYAEADGFEMVVNYQDFPFDPRAIRSMGVTIYIQDMKSLYDETGRKLNIKPAKNNKLDNVIFLGFADEESIILNDNDRTIKFSGRDFTSLYLDAPYIERPLPVDSTVDQIILALSQQLKSTESIQVVNRTGGKLPILSQFSSSFSETGGKRNTRKNETYWDVIQDLARKAGLIAYIELDKLIITKPRALYAQSQAVQFIYGKNLENLQFKRKMGRQKDFNILVRSLDIKNKNVIEVKIPEEATDEWCAEYGIPKKRVQIEKITAKQEEQKEDAPFISFLVPDVNNVLQLTEIGQNIFEELSRQQLEGSLSTKDMIVGIGPTSNPVEFDVTKLRTASPLLIEIIDDRELYKLRRFATVQERVTFLMEKGYARQVATVIAISLGRFNPVFYLKSIELQFDNNDGFTANIDFLNFIEVEKALGQNR